MSSGSTDEKSPSQSEKGGKTNSQEKVPTWVLQSEFDPSEINEEQPRAGSNRIGRLIKQVPEHVVPVCAGFLLPSTTITLVGATALGMMIYTGSYSGDFIGISYDFTNQSQSIIIVEIQLIFATLAQIVSVFYILKRSHWWRTMFLFLFAGTVLVTIPFIIPSLILMLLGKQYFR